MNSVWDIGLHWYGFWVALGVAVWFFLVLFDVRVRAIVSKDQIINLLNVSIVAGLFGGRLLHVLINWQEYSTWIEVFAFWQGGLSVLGSVFGVLWAVWFFAWRHGLPLLRLLDGMLVYAPLAQAFGRIGCFSAGCCYGCPTGCLIGVATCVDGAYSVVHPVQLYNVALLLVFFVALRGASFVLRSPGVLTCLSLFGLLMVRFVTDFWRGDREWVQALPWFSVHQWVSLVGVFFCVVGVVWFSLRPPREVV